MSATTYRKVLATEYKRSRQNPLPARMEQLLDTILTLPHKRREAAFVEWAILADQVGLISPSTAILQEHDNNRLANHL